jgi:hypothetical protein
MILIKIIFGSRASVEWYRDVLTAVLLTIFRMDDTVLRRTRLSQDSAGQPSFYVPPTICCGPSLSGCRRASARHAAVQRRPAKTTLVIGGSPIVTCVPAVPSTIFNGVSLAGLTGLSPSIFTYGN